MMAFLVLLLLLLLLLLSLLSQPQGMQPKLLLLTAGCPTLQNTSDRSFFRYDSYIQTLVMLLPMLLKLRQMLQRPRQVQHNLPRCAARFGFMVLRGSWSSAPPHCKPASLCQLVSSKCPSNNHTDEAPDTAAGPRKRGAAAKKSLMRTCELQERSRKRSSVASAAHSYIPRTMENFNNHFC